MVYLVQEPFGDVEKGVQKFTWTTESGFAVSAISYGAIVTNIMVPDNNGQVVDVVLGFDDLESYLTNNGPYLGAVIGRVANRIAKGRWQLDGESYQVAQNVGQDALHGGLVGFDKKFWKYSIDGTKVTFSYLSPDMEENYPGDVITNVSYDVTDDQTLHMEYLAVADKKTIVNLTNHSYFNLAGDGGGCEELYKHVVTVNADRITETDSNSIPTGQLLNVGGTPFDLRTPTRLSEVLTKHPDLFDDNFCISTYGKNGVSFVSRVQHPPSGRYLEVYSNQPGVQLYTSNFLPAPDQPALLGKRGVGYRRHGAFCLETQNYPDAINHPNFPSPVLKPGRVYAHQVKYMFGADHCDTPSVLTA